MKTFTDFKRIFKNIPIWFWGVLLVSLTLSNIYFYKTSGFRWYSYSSSDGGFTFNAYPAKGRNLDMMERSWGLYRTKEQTTDTVIYRTFPRNYFLAWNWLSYTKAEYDYPYLPTDRMVME